MRLRRRRKRQAPSDPWDQSIPLLHWAAGSPWAIGDSYMGMQIFGSTGSGKTSGSLATICRSMLHAGYGGVFFTVKPEDCGVYTQLVRDAGRSDDLVVFSPKHDIRYNFIAGEQQQSSGSVGLAENLAALLMTIVEITERGSSGSGGDNEGYFKLEAARLARNSLLILVLGGETVTMPDLHRLITTAPLSLEQVQSESWRKSSFCFARIKLADKANKAESQRADFDLALTYLLHEWPALSSRTRSVVQSTLTSATDMLSRGLVRDMVSAPSPNIDPSMMYRNGTILIVDFPVLIHREVGQLIQIIIKHCWQRAYARRDVSQFPRPTFMVIDEYQNLMVAADQQFQAIARSTRTACLFATQSISGMMDVLGSQSEHTVHSLLTNLQTRICHQQTDIRTVQYMQDLIGRSRQMLMNANQSHSENYLAPLFGTDTGGSAGFSETFEYELTAADLNGLAKGGPPHFYTEAIVYQGGRAFPNGKTWTRAVIPQRH